MCEPRERLFFALWPDEAQRCALAELTRPAVSRCGGRPVPVASLHVTLAFLGSVSVSRIAHLQSVAQQVALDHFGPLTLSFDHLEHWAKPQVLCAVSAAPCEGAVRLSAQLQRLTLEAGFSPDIKAFRQHVTLARKVPRAHHDAGPSGPAGYSGPMPVLTWTMTGFALVASRTDSAGPVYSVVESYHLYGGLPPAGHR